MKQRVKLEDGIELSTNCRQFIQLSTICRQLISQTFLIAAYSLGERPYNFLKLEEK